MKILQFLFTNEKCDLLSGYDRTGEGLKLDRSFFDKYGAPVELENFWMEGYHAMDRLLAQHMLAINNREIPFPPVAGYAGTTHLYKVTKSFSLGL